MFRPGVTQTDPILLDNLYKKLLYKLLFKVANEIDLALLYSAQ